MNNFYCHTLNYNIEDRINEINSSIYEFIEEHAPQKVNIIDPYFNVEIIQNFLNDFNPNKSPEVVDGWTFLFNELLQIDSIEEINIITNKIFRTYMIKNSILLNLKQNCNGYSFLCKDKIINFIYYANPGNNEENNKNNFVPDLHDRLILLCNSMDIQGLHIGCSLNNLFGKDLTITIFNSNGAEKASKRYDELLKFSKERVKW